MSMLVRVMADFVHVSYTSYTEIAYGLDLAGDAEQSGRASLLQWHGPCEGLVYHQWATRTRESGGDIINGVIEPKG